MPFLSGQDKIILVFKLLKLARKHHLPLFLSTKCPPQTNRVTLSTPCQPPVPLMSLLLWPDSSQTSPVPWSRSFQSLLYNCPPFLCSSTSHLSSDLHIFLRLLISVGVSGQKQFMREYSQLFPSPQASPLPEIQEKPASPHWHVGASSCRSDREERQGKNKRMGTSGKVVGF